MGHKHPSAGLYELVNPGWPGWMNLAFSLGDSGGVNETNRASQDEA